MQKLISSVLDSCCRLLNWGYPYVRLIVDPWPILINALLPSPEMIYEAFSNYSERLLQRPSLPPLDLRLPSLLSIQNSSLTHLPSSSYSFSRGLQWSLSTLDEFNFVYLSVSILPPSSSAPFSLCSMEIWRWCYKNQLILSSYLTTFGSLILAVNKCSLYLFFNRPRKFMSYF